MPQASPPLDNGPPPAGSPQFGPPQPPTPQPPTLPSVPLAGTSNGQPVASLPAASLPTQPIEAGPEANEAGHEGPLLDIKAMFFRSPPWLISTIFHMVALIVLGLWFVAGEMNTTLLLEARFSEELGEIDLDTLDDLDMSEIELDQPVVLTETLPEVEEPLVMPDLSPMMPDPSSLAIATPSIAIGKALEGRTPGMRDSLRKAYGGTELTEKAVVEGLKWLARNQQSNGAWSLRGPYDGGAGMENGEAATAMALIAFQGHGHTHQPTGNDDPFSPVVRRGWNWLLNQQHEEGHFFKQVGTARLYTQAQCTIAICELYGMTHDEKFRKPAQRAVDYCVKIQTPQGGWRYAPGSGNDLSVTGWFAMALQSARMAGIEVPSETFRKLDRYLDSVEKEYGSRYSYQVRSGATPTMTAEGLLCRQYLGWERNNEHLVDGVDYLLRFLPEWDERNVYHWYYATQVCHHMEGTAWQEWNGVMRQLLPEHQEKRGRERGSWNPNGDRWGSSGGRLYTTCLSIYMLEVYYRHLPLYR